MVAGMSNNKTPLFVGRIDVVNVTFAYPSRPEVSQNDRHSSLIKPKPYCFVMRMFFPFSWQACVLNNFNLTVREGEVVALVGSSGGGKSSIMKLIKRVYEPISGSILLDGKPLSSYENGWLQSNIAAVTQEPVLHDCRCIASEPSSPSICLL